MRRSLGTAVFSGMLGVTLFGIFFTPVFFIVIEGLGESRFFANARVQQYGSAVFGAVAGMIAGVLLHLAGAMRLTHGAALGHHVGRGQHDARDAFAAALHSAHRARACRRHRAKRKRGIAVISHFFIDRPIFASVLSIVVNAGRCRCAAGLAGGAVSRRYAADGAGDGLLSGGERPDRPRHRGRADRAAGQRRREHALHVVAVHQRRHLRADRDVQAGHGFRHGPGAGAESRVSWPSR